MCHRKNEIMEMQALHAAITNIVWQNAPALPDRNPSPRIIGNSITNAVDT
jgi:hypothetical protein